MRYCIQLREINKSFNNCQIIKNISLDIEKGQIVGFIGPNGSGKTTLINIICGLIPIDNGSGYCMGYDISLEQKSIKNTIGYMTQYFTLWETLTVLENVEFIGRVRGVTDIKKEARVLVERLGLERFSHTLAQHLSGGWKQKLSLACALIHQPKLLFLDEPTASIDPFSRKEFWDLIYDLTHQGITILIVTHALDEIERCNTLFYLKHGHLIFSGSLPELFSTQNLSTIVVEGKGIELFLENISRLDNIHIIPKDSNLTITSSLNIDSLRKQYPDLSIQPVRTSLDAVLYNLSNH